MTEQERHQLDRDGYVVLRTPWETSCCTRCASAIHELFVEEGERAGSEFRTEEHAHRLANLVDKGEVFRRAIALPAVIDGVRHVIGPPKLSSLNARSADPHSDAGQPLHVDMAAIPDERGYWVCNTIWMLDDFTPDNGATRVVPGSHKWGTRPQDVLADPDARRIPARSCVTGRAGGVVIMNAHLWHGGTANRTAAPRLAMHAFYCRRDKPQQQYQKQLLRPEVQAALSPELRELLALDDPLNDELSANVAVRSGFMK